MTYNMYLLDQEFLKCRNDSCVSVIDEMAGNYLTNVRDWLKPPASQENV